MHPVERVVREYGGIASTREILARGYETETIRLVASYGRIVPVRQGWYAVPEMPRDSMRAWRAGGRLSCISAAVHHGLWEHNVDELHVRVAANASRVERSSCVVLHWSLLAVGVGAVENKCPT